MPPRGDGEQRQRRGREVTDGWQRRILSKVAGSAAAGFAAGALLSLLSRGRRRASSSPPAPPPPRVAPWAARTAASCAVCAACYAVPLEAVRYVRREHSPLNSAVAGGFAASALASVHRSSSSAAPLPPPAAVAVGLAGATVASAIHFAGDWATEGRGLARPLLESVGLLDPPRKLVLAREKREREERERQKLERQATEERRRQALEAASSSPCPSQAAAAAIVGEPLHPWLEWLPVRKLTPEEAALRKRLKEEEFQENARLAAQGGALVAAKERENRE